MTNSFSDQVNEAWNLIWTDPFFETVPIYLGILAVAAIVAVRWGFGSGGDGFGDGGGDCGGDGC